MSYKKLYHTKHYLLLHKGVLLLQALTRNNGAIQKIVAFENAFERLLDIITEEGNSDGGTVWRDWFEEIPFVLAELTASQECNWREKWGRCTFFVVLLDIERGFPEGGWMLYSFWQGYASSKRVPSKDSKTRELGKLSIGWKKWRNVLIN